MKVEYMNEIRKIPEISNYDALISTLKERFDLQNFSNSAIKLSYKDSDNMKISISTDDDIIEALSWIQEGMMLKIHISIDKSSQAAGINSGGTDEEADQYYSLLEDSGISDVVNPTLVGAGATDKKAVESSGIK